MEKERKNDNIKRKKKKKVLYIIELIVLITIFSGCVIYLAKYFLESKQSEDKFKELRTMIEIDGSIPEEELVELATDDSADAKDKFVYVDDKLILARFANLYRRNTDFIGWLRIDGTVIDYPVMQSMYDEEYYLRRDFDKEYSYAGTLFADTSSDISKPSDNIIIYGHHMNTGKMFHELEEYDDEDYYKKHKTITFDTIYGSGEYEVIAAFRTKIYDEDYTGFKYYRFFDAANSNEFDDYVSNCKSLTNYNIDATATYGDSLITLSTCAYHTENGRFVVVARKLKK